MKYDIIVIDSGCGNFQASYVQPMSLSSTTDIYDNVGHGSSVINIIHEMIPSAKVLSIKITDDYENIPVENLIEALEYIYESKIICNLINISMGITILNKYTELLNCIEVLHRKGIVIVSAYDNSGFVSYPAAFNNVVGVDCSKECKNNTDYIILENSCVNILGTSSYFRTVNHNNEKIIVKGTSYTTATISALILRCIKKNCINNISFETIMHNMRKESIAVGIVEQSADAFSTGTQFVNNIKKAVVFPFNKEIHSIAKFEDLLRFNIQGFYDYRLAGNVGKKIKNIAPHIENESLINNIYDLEWDSSFDSIICGHCSEISSVIGKDILLYLIERCIKYNKKMYSFDDLSKYELIVPDEMKHNFYYPYISPKMVPSHFNGKLSLSSKPVIGVYGTSSRQGKYTIQLLLRRQLISLGYKVGQISSEPSGYLFGMDFVFPFGYHSTVETVNFDTLLILNDSIKKIEQDGCDLILTGSQSNTIPFDPHYVANMCFTTYDFLLGTLPDVVILCVNNDDTIEYITRTIQFICSITNTRVIALIEFNRKRYKSVMNSSSERYSLEDMIYKKYGIPTFSISENDICKLTEYIIDYLAR